MPINTLFNQIGGGIEANTANHLSQDTLNYFSNYSKRLKKERTKKEYYYILNVFCNACGADFLDLTKTAIISYFKKAESSLATMTLQLHISFLRGFATFIDEETALDEEDNTHHYQKLFPDFEFEKIPLKDAPAPNRLLVDRLLTWFYENNHISAFVAVCMVIRCSLTAEELFSLCPNSFIQDQEGNYGIVFPGYRKRYVKVPLDLIPLICTLARDINDANHPIFRTTKRNAPLNKVNFHRLSKMACTELGIPQITLQNLRNFSIKEMICGGASDIEIAEYISTDAYWIHRYNGNLPELKHAAVEYNHIRIVL